MKKETTQKQMTDLIESGDFASLFGLINGETNAAAQRCAAIDAPVLGKDQAELERLYRAAFREMTGFEAIEAASTEQRWRLVSTMTEPIALEFRDGSKATLPPTLPDQAAKRPDNAS